MKEVRTIHQKILIQEVFEKSKWRQKMVTCDFYYNDTHCRQSLWTLKTNLNYA
jgi:hypothetical protein